MFEINLLFNIPSDCRGNQLTEWDCEVHASRQISMGNSRVFGTLQFHNNLSITSASIEPVNITLINLTQSLPQYAFVLASERAGRATQVTEQI
jgi:hypothetical protein